MFWHGKQMYRRLSDEAREAGLASGDADQHPVTEADLASACLQEPSVTTWHPRTSCPHPGSHGLERLRGGW